MFISIVFFCAFECSVQLDFIVFLLCFSISSELEISAHFHFPCICMFGTFLLSLDKSWSWPLTRFYRPEKQIGQINPCQEDWNEIFVANHLAVLI